MNKDIENNIRNLELYCNYDIEFRSQTAEEEKSDFDIFCDNHIADIEAVIQELKTTQSDLYESNKRITDLLLTLGDRDRMIELMVEHIYTGCDFDNNIKTKEQIRKYFEERSK